jgi:cbb3-type cytochrome oxidase maturation protein
MRELMDVLLALIPIAILLGLGAVSAFVWAIRSGQLDDLETPAMRLLLDEDEPALCNTPCDSKPPRNTTQEQSSQ